MNRAIVALVLAAALSVAGAAQAQYGYPPQIPPPDAPPPPPEGGQPLYAPPPAQAMPQAYAPPQLDQMLASIALYPDPLLSSILTASTYPVEVVEADRWVSDPQNAALRDGALAAALESQSWDPSVKSLVPFPQILHMLDAHLQWTQALGNAFLAQQPDVMESIQRLRHAAMAAGTLASNPQQSIVADGDYVRIEPVSPQYVYIPVYNPTMVYGAWPYPAYLPVYYGPPPGLVYRPVPVGISFAVGILVVQPLWRWGHWDWRDHRIDLDRDRFNRINAGRPPVAATVWHHDPGHRGPPAARPVLAPAGQQRPAVTFPQPEAQHLNGPTPPHTAPPGQPARAVVPQPVHPVAPLAPSATLGQERNPGPPPGHAEPPHLPPASVTTPAVLPPPQQQERAQRHVQPPPTTASTVQSPPPQAHTPPPHIQSLPPRVQPAPQPAPTAVQPLQPQAHAPPPPPSAARPAPPAEQQPMQQVRSGPRHGPPAAPPPAAAAQPAPPQPQAAQPPQRSHQQDRAEQRPRREQVRD